MSRLKGIVFLVVGTVVAVLGLGMWESSEINWDGFIRAWSMIGDGVLRLKEDPFAILGIVVLAVGVVMAYYGVRRVVRG
jgi:uncharacterized protein YjeT (DUF2065 family)